MESEIYFYDERNPFTYNNRMGKYKKEKEIHFIKEFCSNNKFNILDVGGGCGRISLPLHNLGHKLVMLEPNRAGVEIAMKNGINSICNNTSVLLN